MGLRYYLQAIFEQEPMVFAWELFVLFMLMMFVSIIIRLARLEKKISKMSYSLMMTEKPKSKRKGRAYNKSLLWWVRKNQNSEDFDIEYDKEDD